MLHTKYQSSALSSFREEEFWSFPCLFLCFKTCDSRGGASFDLRGIIWTKWILPSLLLLFQLMTPEWGQFSPQGYHMNRIDIVPNIIVQGQMIKALLLVSEKKNFKVFLLCSYVSNLWPPGQGPIWPQGHHMNNLGRGPLGDATYEILKLCTFLFQRRKIFQTCFKLVNPPPPPGAIISTIFVEVH